MTQIRRIAVFGGSGFLGHHLVQRLIADGWDVRIAVRNPARVGEMGGEGPKPTPIRADITASDAEIVAAVTGVKAVVNLVGSLAERGRATFQRVHVEGAGRAARAARAAGVARLVHISALGADPAAPAAYARSKAAGEAAVRAAFPAAAGQTYELGGPRTYMFADLMRLMLATVRRRRLLVSLPFPLASVQGAALERLPRPPLTRDQVELLKQDNVVSPGALGLAELGLTPTPIEPVVAT